MLAQTMLSKKWQADAWVVKMNVNNELVWQRQLGKGNDDAIQYAVELPDKSLIIAGYTAAQTANGGKIWVLKLSESGEILWERTLDGVASNGICIKGDAIYLLTSFIDETRIYLPNLVKLDMNGELISNKTYPMLSNARGLVQTKDGQLVILCDKHLIKVADDCLVIASTPFDKIATAYNISNTPDGGFIVLGKKYDFQKEERSDFWVVKYDAAAVLSWQNTYDRDHSQEIALDAAVAPDGTISVVGLSEMENQNHIWLLKLNPTGQLSESLYIGTEKSEKNPKIAYGTDEKLRMIFSAGLEPDVIMALF
jgi:hypothetical protein